jgi:hypothetical protein
MKFAAASTFLFATLALATPAPAAQPDHSVTPAEIMPRAAMPILEERAKKPKPGNSGNNSNSTATMMTPSRALQLGALSLGIMEVVRLW